MPMSQGNIWNLLPSFPNACAGGRHLQQAVWPQLLFSSFLPLSPSAFTQWPVLSAGRICAQRNHVQCISCILVGQGDQGDHWDPPGTQHAWSFTGSNKPTLVSKEVFASNKPAYDILNHSKQKPLGHLHLQEVHKHITFLRHNNIHTFVS